MQAICYILCFCLKNYLLCLQLSAYYGSLSFCSCTEGYFMHVAVTVHTEWTEMALAEQ